MNRLCAPLARALDVPLGDWRPVVEAWRASEAGRALEDFIDGRLAAGAIVYPERPLRSLELTPLARTRVVIVGQDPYHGHGQAEGLAFSVPPGVRHPPSLRNIFAELGRDCRIDAPASGHLGRWAAQGVLLLNAVLSVEDGRPASHAGHGWEALTDSVIRIILQAHRPKVFMLWGGHAQGLVERLSAGPRHLMLKASHPSPLSATRGTTPFIGCGHFSQALEFLKARHDPDPPLDWHPQPS